MIETNFLLNPNIAYLFLSLGLIMAALALLSPGTGILEVGALIALILAGYSVYNLPINYWALVALLVGVILFILAVRFPKRVYFLIAAIAALVLGSAFLFRGDEFWIPAVNPILALVVSSLSAVFFWVVTNKVMEAESVRPTHDLEALVGAEGEARSDIHEQGSVQVLGQLWSAYSNQPIPNGSRIRVMERQGFLLLVEAIPASDPTTEG